MKYVLFDLDGTLTDPGLGITNSVMHALDRFGIEKPPREELYCFIGPPLTDSFNKKFGIPVERAPEAIGYFREYFAEKGILENEIYPGIPELLEALHKKGDMVVLATAKPLRFAKRILDYFDIAKWFDYAAGNERPSEGHFRRARTRGRRPRGLPDGRRPQPRRRRRARGGN